MPYETFVYTHTHRWVKRFVISLLLMVFVASCSKKEQASRSQGLYEYEQTQRNIDYNNLALIVSHALSESQDFRHLVKEEVLYTFDGDYDVLISQLKDLHIKDKTGNKIKVSKFLNGYAKKLLTENKLQGVAERSMQEYIDYLSQQYPNLQISVPVHAEDWTDNYVPVVTFIPEELDDNQNVDIVAYRGNETTSVNSVAPPNQPAVVISDNERSVNNGQVNNNSGAININNWNIQAIQTQAGIRLIWTVDTNDPVFGYYIYRKDASTSNFQRINMVYGSNNLAFDDNTVRSNVFYSYYLVAFNLTDTSSPSNIVTWQAPNLPDPLENFSAILHTPNLLEIRWDVPQNQAVDYINLEKLDVNTDNNYVSIGHYSASTHNVMLDPSSIKGHSLIYRANVSYANNYSNYKYDVLKVPYRDVSRPTRVYLKRINIDRSRLGQYESWIYGAPEFKLYAVVTNERGEKVKLDEIRAYFCARNRHSYNNFNDVRIYTSWQPTSFLDIMTIEVVEVDANTPEVDLNFGAKYSYKNTNTVNASASGVSSQTVSSLLGYGSVSVSFKDVLDSKHKNKVIGKGFYYYTDNPNKVVDLSGSYGVSLELSDHDAQRPECYPN